MFKLMLFYHLVTKHIVLCLFQNLKKEALVTILTEGVVNGPLKNENSLQILPKSRNLTQPSNG